MRRDNFSPQSIAASTSTINASNSAFSAYVQRWNLQSITPDAIWAKGERWFNDAQIEQFVADGGIAAALATIQPHLPKDAPLYDIDPAHLHPRSAADRHQRSRWSRCDRHCARRRAAE